jgi:L-seryl-tRNA(Ser) seleniumtransferase
MSKYSELGVRQLINADSMKTALGGSLMAESVTAAMHEAGRGFVDMLELQAAVSARIAELTHNEAAHVSSGASAGLVLSALACMTGNDLTQLGRVLENGLGVLPRRQFVVQRGQRNPYDPAFRLVGAEIVEVGNVLQTFAWELEAAITDKTAAIVFFAGAHLGFGCLGFDDVVRIARAANLPVIVDAAAQLPPRENLWRFTQRGADLVIFSGGKELRGPQASGLIVGRREPVAACAMHASPNQRLARAMKVGKEEMVGLLVAIENYLQGDDAQERACYERVVDEWAKQLGEVPGLTVEREFPGTDGRPLPRAVVRLGAEVAMDGAALAARMRANDPAIAVAIAGERAIYLNPELLLPGEAETVAAALAGLVRQAAASTIGAR